MLLVTSSSSGKTGFLGEGVGRGMAVQPEYYATGLADT